jgi:hypothetical protein
MAQVTGAAVGNMDVGAASSLMTLNSAALGACGDSGMQYT